MSVIIWPVVLVAGHVPISPSTYRYGVIAVAPLLLITAHLLAKVRLAPLLGVKHHVGRGRRRRGHVELCRRAELPRTLRDTAKLLESRQHTTVPRGLLVERAVGAVFERTGGRELGRTGA